MRSSHRGAFRDQVNVLRRQFLQDGGLPFTDVLTEDVIAGLLAFHARQRDRDPAAPPAAGYRAESLALMGTPLAPSAAILAGSTRSAFHS